MGRSRERAERNRGRDRVGIITYWKLEQNKLACPPSVRTVSNISCRQHMNIPEVGNESNSNGQ